MLSQATSLQLEKDRQVEQTNQTVRKPGLNCGRGCQFNSLAFQEYVSCFTLHLFLGLAQIHWGGGGGGFLCIATFMVATHCFILLQVFFQRQFYFIHLFQSCFHSAVLFLLELEDSTDLFNFSLFHTKGLFHLILKNEQKSRNSDCIHFCECMHFVHFSLHMDLQAIDPNIYVCTQFLQL